MRLQIVIEVDDEKLASLKGFSSLEEFKSSYTNGEYGDEEDAIGLVHEILAGAEYNGYVKLDTVEVLEEEDNNLTKETLEQMREELNMKKRGRLPLANRS